MPNTPDPQAACPTADHRTHTPAEAVQYWYDAAAERLEERNRLRVVVARIGQMADAWEQRLPDVIRTPAVVSAIRAALEGADGSRLAEAPQPETQAETAAALLASPCDACRHTLNWHRNDVGCTLALCVCSRFQPPVTAAPAVVAQPGKEN